MGEGMEAMDYGQADENAERKPQFFIKQKGEVVGAGWLKEGQFGKYVSIAINKDLQAGSRAFINPRKGFEGVFA